VKPLQIGHCKKLLSFENDEIHAVAGLRGDYERYERGGSPVDSCEGSVDSSAEKNNLRPCGNVFRTVVGERNGGRDEGGGKKKSPKLKFTIVRHFKTDGRRKA